MRYRGTIYRPPSEAESYLLQVTFGCSHNRCAFCGTYPGIRFEERDAVEIFEDIELASHHYPETGRVFLIDGNALVLRNDKLEPILERLGKAFPRLDRVGAYLNARDALGKNPEELKSLEKRGLRIGYIGLESGSDRILSDMNKGATSEEIVAAVKRMQEAGIAMSVIMILGLGGTDLWQEHAIESAKAVNRMQPLYLSALTLMPVEGTPLARRIEAGTFRLPDTFQMLRELYLFLENLELSSTVFRSNHASNYLPLKGAFPEDKDKLLNKIEWGLSHPERLRPEWLRGL